MAKMKSYTDVNPDTGRPFLAETPFPTPQRMAEYLRSQAQPNEYTITTGAPALSISASEEAYQKAVDAYEQDTGTGKYAPKQVELREPAQRPTTNTDAAAVNAAIANYDTLSADDIISQADSVPAETRPIIARYEKAKKNRTTVIAAFSEA